MGFTVKQVKREFDEKIGEVVDDLERTVIQSQERRQSKFWQELCGRDEDVKRHSERIGLEEIERLNTIRNTTFEDWLETFHEIIVNKISPYRKNESEDERNLLVKYILGYYTSDDYGLFYPFHFPSEDIRSLLRVFIEVSPSDALVAQDITDLVHGKYYAPDEAVCEEAINALTRDYPTNEKIIVLTEGSTDKEVLEQSLKLLYPHLGL